MTDLAAVTNEAAARRAISRWAFRLFLRERRQQLVIVTVIAIAVAAAMCSVAMVFNIPASEAAHFGTARQLITLNSDDPAENSERVESARELLGPIEVVGHVLVGIPGTAESYDARSQDPSGRFSAGMVGLLDGRFPTTRTEIAITDEVATTFAAHIGSDVRVGGTQRTVVGIVENSYDLDDEFILLQPSIDEASTSLTVLADATPAQLQSYQRSAAGSPMELRPSSVGRVAAAAMLAASAVVFLLVALVASAGFAVVAQRRMRQLGMLGALGATDRHLKLVLLVHGAIVGVVASVSGGVLGLIAWFSIAHRLEGAAGHRIDAFHLPWSLLLGAVVAGVLVPLAAAWWPSRSLPRMSIVDAISARPPTPRRARASVVGAALFLAGGVALVGASNQTNPVLIVGGTVTLVIGMLLACPAAVRAMARLARRAPVTPRVALRDLGRYQTRSGAALAAISLALGIPVAIILVAGAADRTAAETAGAGNLADTQLLITIDHSTEREPLAPNLTTQQLSEMRETIADLAASLDNATVVPLEMAVDPATAPDGHRLIDLGEPVAGTEHLFHPVSMFVASSELLDYLGVDTTSLPATAEILATSPDVILIGKGARGDLVSTHQIAPPRYSALPRAFITRAGIASYGLQTTPIGWILEAGKPVTDTELASIRQTAASSGFTVEARHGPDSHTALKTSATLAGALFALAIVAMTVGTIRAESAAELRTLTATGASGTIRRALTAATAAALALAGVVLGTIGAYLGMVGAYVHHLSRLGDVPIANLVSAIIGVPLLAYVVGWCLGGREPRAFARQSAD